MDQPLSVVLQRNRLLAALSPGDLDLLLPHLARLVAGTKLVFEEPNQQIEHVYFMEAGIASVVAVGTRGKTIEVGLIGREGMSGLAIVLGNDRSPTSTYIQVAGEAQRIGANELRSAMHGSRSMHGVFLRYVQAFMTQTTHTAIANGRANLEERLARWLLMALDRVDGDELPLTHEFLALMLGVRRAGVTVTLQSLEGRGLIRAHRAHVAVIDREGLESLADGSYGVPEAEYRRLMN